MLCKYKNIFGQVNTGLHKYRLFNIAIIDVIATIIFSYLIHKFTKIKFCYLLIFMFTLGIIMHRLLCVRTTIDKILF